MPRAAAGPRAALAEALDAQMTDSTIGDDAPGRPDRRVAFSVDTERPFPGADESARDYLELFARRGMPATFFVVGQVAEARPELVDAIHYAGHEIACHNWDHPLIAEPEATRTPFVDELDDAALEWRLRRCQKVLERDGMGPRGFRAPWFRIHRRNLAVVARHFRYDSSLAAAPGQRVAAPDGLAELPVTRLAARAPRLGTPTMFGPGAGELVARWMRWRRPAGPLMLYGHSFDLMDCTGQFPATRFKRAWYFDRCGPARVGTLERVFDTLEDLGYRFVTCEQLLKAA